VAAEMTRLKNYDFFSILQQIPSTRMIPILLFTSNNEKEVPAFCKAKHRPIKIQDLINKIRPYVNAAKSTIIRADI
jgi:CheY-like chemotaxis protein